MNNGPQILNLPRGMAAEIAQLGTVLTDTGEQRHNELIGKIKAAVKTKRKLEKELKQLRIRSEDGGESPSYEDLIANRNLDGGLAEEIRADHIELVLEDVLDELTKLKAEQDRLDWQPQIEPFSVYVNARPSMAGTAALQADTYARDSTTVCEHEIQVSGTSQAPIFESVSFDVQVLELADNEDLFERARKVCHILCSKYKLSTEDPDVVQKRGGLFSAMEKEWQESMLPENAFDQVPVYETFTPDQLPLIETFFRELNFDSTFSKASKNLGLADGSRFEVLLGSARMCLRRALRKQASDFKTDLKQSVRDNANSARRRRDAGRGLFFQRPRLPSKNLAKVLNKIHDPDERINWRRVVGSYARTNVLIDLRRWIAIMLASSDVLKQRYHKSNKGPRKKEPDQEGRKSPARTRHRSRMLIILIDDFLFSNESTQALLAKAAGLAALKQKDVKSHLEQLKSGSGFWSTQLTGKAPELSSLDELTVDLLHEYELREAAFRDQLNKARETFELDPASPDEEIATTWLIELIDRARAILRDLEITDRSKLFDFNATEISFRKFDGKVGSYYYWKKEYAHSSLENLRRHQLAGKCNDPEFLNELLNAIDLRCECKCGCLPEGAVVEEVVTVSKKCPTFRHFFAAIRQKLNPGDEFKNPYDDWIAVSLAADKPRRYVSYYSVLDAQQVDQSESGSDDRNVTNLKYAARSARDSEER